MTYEEKLDFLLSELIEARKFSRTGEITKLFLNNLISRLLLDEALQIMLQLQDDVRVIKILEYPSAFKHNLENEPAYIDYFPINILDTFDGWYEKYLLRKKSNPRNSNLFGLLLERLQGIYDRAIGTQSSKVFFLSVYEYIETFENTDDLTPVWKEIVEMGKMENKPLNVLEEESFEEIRVVYREIQKYVDKNKILCPGVLSSLKEFQALEDGDMTSSSGPLRARGDKISYALMLLAEEKSNSNLNFCRKYGTVEDDGRVVEWHFSPSFIKWEEERKRMDRLKITRIWFSWDKLANFYIVYKDYEKIQTDRIKSSKIFEIWDLKMLFDEIAYVISEKKDPNKHIYEYIHSDYVLHLQRLHQYTKDKLMTAREEIEQNKNSQISIEEKPKKESNAINGVTPKNNKEILSCGRLQLDLDKGTLCFGSKTPVEISPDNNAIKLLTFLLNNQRVVEYKEMALLHESNE